MRRTFLSVGLANLLQVSVEPVRAAVPVHQATSTISIDGIASDIPWERAARRGLLRPRPVTPCCRWLWNTEGIFVFIEVTDSDLVTDPSRARDGETWNDDVVEFFLKPTRGDSAYGEFHVTAAGVLMDALFPRRAPDAWPRVVHADSIRFEAAAARTRTGWAVEAFVPWADLGPLGSAPQPGDRWQYNVARYDWTRNADEPVLSSLVRQKQPDFHRHEDWPALRFLED